MWLGSGNLKNYDKPQVYTTRALRHYQPEVQACRVCDNWRDLYAIAWTDFYRFLAGWMPDHPKTHAYTRQLASQALAEFPDAGFRT